MALHLTEMMATDKVFEAGKITATLGGLNVLHTTTYSSSRLTAWASDGDNSRTRRTATWMTTFITNMATGQLIFTEISTGMGR